MARPSCLHGVHWPQDSTARNLEVPATAATRSSWSSKTVKPQDPSPLPAATMAS